jgi:hypothetical protein
MQFVEQPALKDRKKQGRWISLELFYFEQIGSRSYLRITKLGLVLILLFTILPVIIIFSLFLFNRSTPMPNVDVTIKPMSTDNTSISPAIHQPTPPPALKVLRQPKAAQPSPPTLPSSIRNINER